MDRAVTYYWQSTCKNLLNTHRYPNEGKIIPRYNLYQKFEIALNYTLLRISNIVPYSQY